MKKSKSVLSSIANLFNFKNSAPINLTGLYDPVFLILIFTLLCFGMVMLFSASFARAFYFMNGNSLHYISKQMVNAAIGLVGMFIIAKIDYRKYLDLALATYIIGVLLLVITLVFGIPDKHGIKRWLYVGPLQFQPSEMTKFAIILLFSAMISKNYKKMHLFHVGVLKFVTVLGLVLFLMFLQPHLSGAVVICSIAGTMMFVGGTKPRWFALVFTAAVLALIYIMFFKGNYMSSRTQGWLDPFSDPKNETMQTCQSLLAIGSGGIFGLGFGQSRQKFLFLPEVQNDFVFAVICEELGVVGAFAVIVLFLCFCYKGFEIATKTNDKFGCMFCTGIVSQFIIQAIFNIAVVTSTIPNTGISLPFFSYGGTALIVQLCELGIVLNISKHSNTPKLLKIKIPTKKPKILT